MKVTTFTLERRIVLKEVIIAGVKK